MMESVRSVTQGDQEDWQPFSRSIPPRHLSAVLPALSASLGEPLATPVHPDARTCQRDLGLPDAASAIVIVVDGLGFHNLEARIGHAPNLRAILENQLSSNDPASILSCQPTTTTAALGVFGTGTCPGLTGMLGYTQLNPDKRRIAQMIQFSHALKPLDLQRVPTLFERLSQKGTRVTSIGLEEFSRSPLTQADLRGTDYQAIDDPVERIRQAARLARRPGLTYLYFRAVDKAGHAFGWRSEEWAGALEEVDGLVGLLLRLAPRGTLVVLTADHGMVDMDPGQQVDIASDPVLRDGLWLVGGEPRARMLYTEATGEALERRRQDRLARLRAKSPRDPEPGNGKTEKEGARQSSEQAARRMADRWRERLGESAIVLTKSEAIDRRLFGPVDPRVEPMIGDVVVLAAHRVTIVDSRTEKPGAMAMPGVHGSHTEMERRIPLLVDLL